MVRRTAEEQCEQDKIEHEREEAIQRMAAARARAQQQKSRDTAATIIDEDDYDEVARSLQERGIVGPQVGHAQGRTVAQPLRGDASNAWKRGERAFEGFLFVRMEEENQSSSPCAQLCCNGA